MNVVFYFSPCNGFQDAELTEIDGIVSLQNPIIIR